jgi:PAS domain S-box-containing protein
VLDTQGRIVRINRKGAEILGKPVDSMLGTDWFQNIPEPNREHVRQAFHRLTQRQDQALEYYDNPVRTARGTERLIHWHNALHTDDAGNVTGTISSGDDVTEQRAAQALLQDSEQRYRTLLESIRDGVFTADLDGRFTHVNDAILRRSGYPAEWWLGRTLTTVVLDEYRELITDRLAAAMRGQTAPPYEFAYRTASGDTIYVEHVTAPMYEDDRIIGIMGVSRDITDRKQADKRLQESEDRFRRLVELAPDGIAVHQDGRIVLVNPAGARILGYDSPDEMLGKPVAAFVCEQDRPLAVARIRRVLEQGKPGELVEECFVRKDGSQVPVEVVNAPFVWRGRPAVQVMVRDITERKRLTAKAKEAAVQMSAILENSPEGIAAECEGTIAYANWRFIQLYGYEGPAQVVGRPVTDFVAPEDRERLADYSRQRLSGKPAPATYTFRGLRCDGSFVRVETTVSTYQLQDKTYILAFLHEAPAGSRNG